MEIDVSVDLVSSSCCGVRSPQGKMKQMKKWKNKKHFKRRNLEKKRRKRWTEKEPNACLIGDYFLVVEH